MAPGRRKRTREGSLDALPTLFRRGRWWAADFRAWGKGRLTLRDPAAFGWPVRGERAEDPEVALRWTLEYVREFREETRRRQLKLGPKPRRLGAAADAWLELRRRTRAHSTWQGNRTALNHLRAYAGEDLSTDRLTTPVLQEFFDHLHQLGYAENTLRVFREAVSGFLSWLHGAKPRAPNAATEVLLPAVVHEEVHTWTPAERAQLVRAADELDRQGGDFRRHRLLVELGLGGGLRRNELFALRWPQIREEPRTVRITHQVHKDHCEIVPLKGKLARTALLLPSWWAHHQDGSTGLVLGSEGGDLINPTRFVPIRRRLLDRAGLHRPGLGFHIDRHTYARDFIELGGRFEELQKSLGHKSVTTAERLYGHFHEDVAADLARRRIYREQPLRVVR